MNRILILLFALFIGTAHANESSGSSGRAVLSSPDGSPLAVDGFDVLRTSQQSVMISVTFEGDTVDPTFVRDISTGGGSLSQADGVLTLNGDNATAGIESVEVLRYVTKTGFSAGGTLGVTAGTGSACLGLRDSLDNGTWACVENGAVKLYRGNADGVVSACAAGCDEVLNGSVSSGFDATKLNVFDVTAGYFGTKNIIWRMAPPGVDGGGHVLHTFRTQGTIAKPHIGVPRLPMRVTASAGVTAITSSIGAAIDGEVPATRDIPNCFVDGPVSPSDNTETPIVGFRVVETFHGIPNTIAATATAATYASDRNGMVTFKVLANPTVTNSPTWSNIRDDNESVIEYSTDITIDPSTGVAYAPEVLIGSATSKGDGTADLRDIGLRGRPGDTFVLTVKGNTGTGVYNALATYCWIEER